MSYYVKARGILVKKRVKRRFKSALINSAAYILDFLIFVGLNVILITLKIKIVRKKILKLRSRRVNPNEYSPLKENMNG